MGNKFPISECTSVEPQGLQVLIIYAKFSNCMFYLRRDNIRGAMKKYQLTEDMAQDRKYRMTKILAGSAQGDGQER